MEDENKKTIGSVEKKTEEKKSVSGARNLLLLGLLSILIAMSTTGISLAIYHNSGDIYLDRSRPGFLPDEEEIEEDETSEKEYNFEKSGTLTTEILEEYLKNLEVENEAVKAYEKPFDAQVLSDEHLGITETKESETTEALPEATE